MTTAAQLHASSAERDSVSNLLPIGDYRPDLGGFTRVDGAHTILAEVIPFAGFDRPNDVLEGNSEAIAQGLSSLLPGTTFHATWWLSRRIEDAIEAYRAMGGEDIPILKTMEDARVDLMRQGAEKPLLELGAGRGFYTRRLRLVIGITIRPQADELPTLLSGLHAAIAPGAPARKRAEAARQAIAKRAKDQWSILASKLSLVGCKVTSLDSEANIRAVREILYPISGYKAPVDTETWLPEYLRIPLGELISDRAQGTVETDGVIMRCATLKGHPQEVFPGMISLPNGKLGGSTILDFMEQGHITINATAREKEATRFHLQQLLLAGEGGMGMPGRQQQAYDQAMRALGWIESENRRMFDVEMIAVSYDTTKERADERISQLAERLTEVSARFQVETHAAPSFILRSLPGCSQLPIPGAERDVMLVDRQIADQLPVAYRHRGTKEGLTLFHGVNGEPFPFSLWGGTSQGFIISGRPGQGKTFAAESILWDTLRFPGSQAIIIDKGNSYLAMTLSFKESGIYQNLGKGLCRINVLGGSWDLVGPFALNFLGSLLSRRGSVPLSEGQLGVLSTNLRKVFEENASNRPFITTEELTQSLTKRTHLASAIKRMTAEYVNPETEKLIATLGKQDTTIKVWYRYVIVSFHQAVPGDKGHLEEHPVRTQQDLVDDVGHALRNLGFVLDTQDTSSGTECVALHQNPDLADILREKLIQAAVDLTSCIVDVSTEDDVTTAEKAGIVFKVPTELMADEARRIRHEIVSDAATRSTDEQLIDQVITRRLGEVGGIQVYRSIAGVAVIQNEVTLGDLGRRLEDLAMDGNNPDLIEILNRLRPYYGDGPYARFFDGSTTLNLEGAKIVDIELADLATKVDEHIFSSIFAALVQYLNLYMQSPANRSRRKVIIIEEAWQLIRDSRSQQGGATVVGDAIVELLRTGRKHGVATGIVTQNITDLTATASGREIIENAPIKLTFRQAESAMAGAVSALMLSPEQASIMSGVRSEPGYYSQMVIIAPEHTPPVFESIILIPHPIQYWLNTTKPEDVTYREREVDKLVLAGVPEDEARSRVTQHCASQYPHGYRV